MNALWQLFQQAGLEHWVLRHPYSSEEKTLRQLAARVSECRDCALGEARKQAVLGSGKGKTDLLIVRASPDQEEELCGLPLVGESGRLFDAILASQSLSRDEVHLSYLLKCRSQLKYPLSVKHWESCSKYFFQQISVIQPKVVVVLGEQAAQLLLNKAEDLSVLRGKAYPLSLPDGARLDAWVTYDPADLLTAPQEKRKAWEDWQAIKAALSH